MSNFIIFYIFSYRFYNFYVAFLKCIESKHFFLVKLLSLKQDFLKRLLWFLSGRKKVIESRIFLAKKLLIESKKINSNNIIESRILRSKKLQLKVPKDSKKLIESRILKLKKLLYIFIFLTLILQNLQAKNYGGNYDWRMIGGGPLQLVSFHIGLDSSITHNGSTGYSIGASVGWNYFSAFYNVLDNVEHTFDVGFRVKYMFNHSAFETHLVGFETYLHFPCATSDSFLNFPQPVSLIVGGGAIFPYKDSKSSPNTELLAQQNALNGYYFEFGIGLAKYFIVNVNLLYRVSFFNEDSIKAMNNLTFSPQNFNLQPIEHSFHIEFAIF
ncbi:hypothetical protein [Helicobacter saguini]|uniref:hypothetical protein n=1 Tax=Helicobacter saguini TaxID=1548018 RepID=UPI000B21B30E|nr:hypothetical protein [Helicobacter saguini]